MNDHSRDLPHMLLFYSQNCPYCKMLFDTVKRHDQRGMVKMVCIESLQGAGRAIPPQVHSVPALMLMPKKEFIFGKHVFDYLLLPGRGKLLVGLPPTQGGAAGAGAATASTANEPAPFAFASGGVSDAFTSVDESGAGAAQGGGEGYADRAYGWSTIDEVRNTNAKTDGMPFQEETRSRKDEINVDAVRMQRELELNAMFTDGR